MTGNSLVYIQNNFTLDGTLTLGSSSSYGVLYFESGTNQTLGGSGTVVFSGTSSDDSVGSSSGTLTIGSGIYHPGPERLRRLQPVTGGSPTDITVINQGTIQPDISGSTITIDGTGSQNTGSLEAVDGATLLLEGTLTNSATISVDATSVLSVSGTLTGGTISIQAGGQVVGGVLNNVTVSGNWQLTGNSLVYIQNNFTLDGTLTLGSSSFLRCPVLRKRDKPDARRQRHGGLQRHEFGRFGRNVKRHADYRRRDYRPGADWIRRL